MGTWAVWALALVQPVVSRILVALGLSVVTMTGVSAVMNEFVAVVTSSWGALPAAIASLAQYAGIGQAFSIIGSAIATKLFMQAAARGVKFATKTPG